MRLILFTTIVFVFSACGEAVEDRYSQLLVAQDKWEFRVWDGDYKFELIKHCYCPDNGKSYLVNVVNGQVVGAKDGASSLQELTMRDHFAMIREMIYLQYKKKGEVGVVYSKDLGFPKK